MPSAVSYYSIAALYWLLVVISGQILCPAGCLAATNRKEAAVLAIRATKSVISQIYGIGTFIYGYILKIWILTYPQHYGK